MNVDGDHVRRSSTTTKITTQRLSPVLVADFSSTTLMTDEPSGSSSNRATHNGSHKRGGGGGGGGGRKNGTGVSHSNGVNGRKGGRSASPVASSIAEMPSTSTSGHARNSTVLTVPVTSSTIPAKRKHPNTMDGQSIAEEDSDSIRCICGFSIDDGWSVGCDGCGRWVHGVCFGFEATDKENLPDHWWCWECDPSLRERIDRDKARSIQIARLTASGGTTVGNGRRRTSPGVERKVRKINTSAGAGPSSSIHSAISTNSPSTFSDHASHKRKRTSVISASPLTTTSAFPFPPHSANQTSSADDYVDIDESWSHSYIDITQDIVPQAEVRERLRKQAAEWRGVSAISPIQDVSSHPGWPYFDTSPVRDPQATPSSAPPVSLRPLNSNPGSVLPPSYAVHTTHPIPSQSYLAPYPSVITSSSTYLQDPLNAYATLGMPKPKVHLLGPPLDLSLDARGKGGKARFVRSGCRPNAVLRPVLCSEKRERGPNPNPARQHDLGSTERAGSLGVSESPESLSFAIFALRDLKAEEEIVLGWEWDDANVVHLLPALLEDQGIFPPSKVAAYKIQMANILRALGTTFTSCACGERAQGCVMQKMKEFIDDVDNWMLQGKQHEVVKNDAESEPTRESDSQGTADSGSRRTSERNRDQLPQPYPPQSLPSTSAGHLSSSTFVDSNERLGFTNPSLPSHPLVRTSPLSTQQQLDEETKSFTVPLPARSDHVKSNQRPVMHAGHPSAPPVDLGPLIGVRRGFRTREKVPGSGGLTGVEMDVDVDAVNPSSQTNLDPRKPTTDSVRLGPREDLELSKLRLPHDKSMMYGNQAALPFLNHIPSRGTTPHPYAYPLHGFSPFPSPIDPYGAFYGPPYVLPYAPSHAPTPESPLINSGINGEKETLYWGERPHSSSRKDKGKERALDQDEISVDVENDEIIDVEAGKEDGVVDGPVQLRKRHRRKRSIEPHSKPSPTVLTSDGPAEESEMPPKMKRRWKRKENGHSSSDQEYQRAVIAGNVDIGEAGRTQLEDVGKAHASTILTVEHQKRQKRTASPTMMPDSPASASIKLDRRKTTIPPTESPKPTATNIHPSATSPLLSFANLSLLSPAAPITSPKTSYPFSDRDPVTRPTSKPISWDTPSFLFRHSQFQSIPAKQRSHTSSPQISHPRRIVTDPLAALAAAAAAARPISPLPPRTISESQPFRSPRLRHSAPGNGSFYTDSASGHDARIRDTSMTSPPSPPRTGRVSTNHNDHSSDPNVPRSRLHKTQHTDYATPRSREQSQVSEMLENVDAVLGPGGIRVLSSPEHQWQPLRRGSMSSEVAFSGSTNSRSASSPRDRLSLARKEIDKSNTPSESLMLKQELLDEIPAQPSVYFNSVVAEPIPLDPMQVDTTPSGHQSSVLLSTVHEDEDIPLLSPTDSYVPPISPSTPPQNLDETPPWPASPSAHDSPLASGSNPVDSSIRPTLSAKPPEESELTQDHDGLHSAGSVTAAPHASSDMAPAPPDMAPTPSIQSQTIPSPMSALSSVGSSPSPNHDVSLKEARRSAGTEAIKIKTPSPLSSPLSSPMEKLISLPPHSAPAEESMEMDHPEPCDPPLSPVPSAAADPSQPSGDIQTHAGLPDVPDLDHSTSMSPLQSPGNISPTTPREGEPDEIEAMDVDMHDASVGEAALPNASVQAKLSSNDLPPTSASSLATPTEIAAAPKPTSTKVKKISLKDFAIRKRRQKEEEQREKEEKAKEEHGKVNEPEQQPMHTEQEKETTTIDDAVESHDLESSLSADTEKIQESTLPPLSPTELDALSAPMKAVDPPTIDFDQVRRNHPKSDVDVITKASEMLNKLMNSSSLSSTSSGSTDRPALPPYSSAPSVAVLMSPTTSVSPVINHASLGPITQVVPPSTSGPSRLRRAVQPSASQMGTTVDDYQHSQIFPEDGEIEDGENDSMVNASASPIPPITSTVKATPSSFQPSSNTPRSHSPPPPPRAFRLHEPNAVNEQRSRTPPTQPRSFTARSPSVSFIPNGSPPPRSMGLASTPTLNGSSPTPNATASTPNPNVTPATNATTSALGRAPPSGPRALRQMQQQQQQQHNGGSGGYLGARSGNAYIPRGVPYDPRDRDRFRDRAGGSDFVKDRDRDRDLHWNAPGARIRARDVGGWAR
ncbi:Le.MFB1 [Lentinula raphanica]|uniref:Le.MFB1 n=1 Tax=Lentinula raphanica TaxID=153919 RepID=A0AA38PJN3_9AGAR|nr:Le.MFB1 [Lentinula raphanica]KAJ3844178.1 Le.MFB1 [Lentinula raphanica]KAJ3971773.1 Le.MFB1 [Lentinula raphanica]